MAVNVPTVRRWSATALALVLAAGTLAACGSSSSSKDSSSTTSGSTAPASSSRTDTTSASSQTTAGAALSVSPVEKGEDNYTFTKKTLTAKAGSVTLKDVNGSSNAEQHGIAIEGNGVDKDGPIVSPGSTSTVTVKLKPGTYTYYCPVPEHEKYGMKGMLIVQ